MDYNVILRIIEVGLQVFLVIFAGAALFTWKQEIRGRDQYKLAKSLLVYIKEIRFLIHSKNGSLYQIYLNDILEDRKKFYKEQLHGVGQEVTYFDQSVWGLFSGTNIRSDIFLPQKIRRILNDIAPSSSKRIGTDKSKYTYLQLFGIETPAIMNLKDEDISSSGIQTINGNEGMTIEEYFKKWEKLIIELRKFA